MSNEENEKITRIYQSMKQLKNNDPKKFDRIIRLALGKPYDQEYELESLTKVYYENFYRITRILTLTRKIQKIKQTLSIPTYDNRTIFSGDLEKEEYKIIENIYQYLKSMYYSNPE
jgi:hypothetical protein